MSKEYIVYIVGYFLQLNIKEYYGTNSGCWSFKFGDEKIVRFLPRSTKNSVV